MTNLSLIVMPLLMLLVACSPCYGQESEQDLLRERSQLRRQLDQVMNFSGLTLYDLTDAVTGGTMDVYVEVDGNKRLIHSMSLDHRDSRQLYFRHSLEQEFFLIHQSTGGVAQIRIPEIVPPIRLLKIEHWQPRTLLGHSYDKTRKLWAEFSTLTPASEPGGKLPVQRGIVECYAKDFASCHEQIQKICDSCNAQASSVKNVTSTVNRCSPGRSEEACSKEDLSFYEFVCECRTSAKVDK